MLEQFKRMASSAFDALLDTYDMQEQDVDARVRFEQKLCGLWLALRRGALNLTLEQVAYRSQLDPYLLTLLETGLATSKLTTQDFVQAYQWRQLALILENETQDFDWVMAVINARLGMPSPDRAQVLKQVYDELATPMQRLEELEQREVLSELLTDVAPATGQALDTEFALRPELAQTLVALANGASTTLAIRKEITTRTQGQFAIGIATIHRVLQALQKDSFIQSAGETTYQENIYALTADGLEIAQMAVRVENHRVELDAQRQLAQKIEEEQTKRVAEQEEQTKRVAEQEQRLIEEQRQLNARLRALSFAG